MPSTARSVLRGMGERYGGAATLYQPETIIPVGSTFATLMTRFNGNHVKSLAAYNAGLSRVSRWRMMIWRSISGVDSIPLRRPESMCKQCWHTASFIACGLENQRLW